MSSKPNSIIPLITGTLLAVLAADLVGHGRIIGRYIPSMTVFPLGLMVFAGLTSLSLFIVYLEKLEPSATGSLNDTNTYNFIPSGLWPQGYPTLGDKPLDEIDHDIEDKLRRLMENMCEGIIELDQADRVVYANELALQILDRRLDEIKGRDFIKLVRPFPGPTPLDKPQALAEAIRAKRARKLFSIWIRNTEDIPLPVSVTVSPIQNGGDSVGTIISMVDITDIICLKHAIDALYENDSEGYIIFSDSLQPLDCNERFLKMFNCHSKEDFLARFFEYSPEFQIDDHPEGQTLRLFVRAHRDAMINGRTHLRWKHRDADGNIFICEVTLSHVSVNRKGVFVATVKDTRAREKCEEIITELHDRFRRMLDTAPIAMIIVAQGRLRRVNSLGRELFGLEEGSQVVSLLVEREDQLYFAEQTAKWQEIRNYCAQLKRRDGEIIYAIIDVFPFLHENEESFLVWIRNVTELEMAKQTAERSSEAKSNFLARMSHELRTPLNVVIGTSYLCLQSTLTEKQAEQIVKIKNAAETLLSFINDIMDLTMLDSGTFNLKRKSFVLDDLLENVLEMLSSVCDNRDIDFSIKVASDTPFNFYGDPDHLKQILLNLCMNALNFTDSGSVSVDVRYYPTESLPDDHKCELYFKIIDTGRGMTKEQVERCFIPFMNISGVTRQERHGVGMGIPLAKKLIEEMGGNIWINSSQDVGTTVRFTVVVETAPGDESLADRLTDGGREIRILLVEDDEINREIAVEILKSFGAAVDTAANGAECVAILKDRLYDLVLMDIQMPVMDGLTAARVIRNDLGYTPDILPIVAMTAHALNEDYAMSIESGMNDHLTKPIDPEQLREAVKRHCEGCLQR